MKLGFFSSQQRRNSGRGKVIGKMWIYLERNTFHRQSVVRLKRREWSWETHTPQTEWGPSQKVRAAPRYGAVSFHGLGNFTG